MRDFAAPETPVTGSDPVLHPFLFAATEIERTAELRRLLEEVAAPIIRRVVQRKGSAAEDGEDVSSSVREELIRQLTLLRARERDAPIADFRAYTSAVTYATWAEHLRTAYPARAMLLNRLRYLLENRTQERGFTIWNGAAGERWCGLEKWREHLESSSSPRLQLLLVDPAAAAREALVGADARTMPLAQLLTALLGWLGQPLTLRDLVDATGTLLEISDRKEALEQSWTAEEATDPAPTPVEALQWDEYLRWLWRELAGLSLPQRTAFLLHADVVRELELSGVASLRQIAALLEIPAETMAELWFEIPLGDLAIAARLRRERQQIINLRRVARDRLGRAWKEWIK